jgi:hypothetical protein
VKTRLAVVAARFNPTRRARFFRARHFFIFFGAKTMDLIDPTSTAAEIIDYYDRHPNLTLRELSSMTGRSIAYLKGLLMHPEKVKA